MNEQHADILVVEDDPNDLELTMRALKRHHLANAVEVARDGVEALQRLLGEDGNSPMSPPPKVVLLDLKLPKLSGLEVLRRIKSDPRTRRIPVVMLTSSQEDRDIAECYDAGANSYIVKPVDFERFIEAMRVVGLFWMAVASNPAAIASSESAAG